MGHNICHYDFPENVDKDSVYENLNTIVMRDTWREGGSLSNIRWYDTPPLDSIEDAKNFIAANDRNWYDNLAVRYHDFDETHTSKTYLTLLDRRQKAVARHTKLSQAIYAESLQSAYISCKHCGSKLNRMYLLNPRNGTQQNCCPVCHEDLRPETTLTNIQKAKDAIAAIDAKILDEKRKLTKRFGEVRWLVKIEYHT